MPTYVIHRGSSVDKVIISNTEPTAPDGYIVSTVNSVLELNAIKNLPLMPTPDGLRDLRDELVAATMYNGVWYDSNPPSQTKIMGAAQIASMGAWPVDGYTWRAYDNSWHTFYAADVQNLFVAMYQRTAACYMAFKDDSNLIAAGQPPTNLASLPKPE